MRLRNRGVWLLLLALILALAFLIRSWNINKESFWADEGWTMLLAKGPTLTDVVRTMANDQHPPLYFAMMHTWIDLTGNSEFSTRMLSLFWSVVGVALIYRLGADNFSPTAGAVAALILALTDNDTFLAQDARHYTAMATLATASALFYLRYLRRPTRSNGIGWLLCSVALIYTHYLGFFVLIIQLIHLLILARPLRRLGDLLIRWGAILLAWLPWAFVFIHQSMVRYTRPILFKSTWDNSPESLSIVRTDLIGSHFGLTGGLILLGLVYISYFNGIPKIRLQPLKPTLYAAMWLVLPISVIIGINPYYPILTTRNFLIVTPVIALLIGHGIMNLDRLARVFVLVALVAVMLITVDAYFVKPPYRKVAQDILQYWVADEPIIMNVWVDDLALRYHIGRDLHTDPATLPLLSVREWEEKYGLAFDAYLLQYISDKSSLWVAQWGDPDEVIHFIEQHGFTQTVDQIETHLQVTTIHVYRYDRIPTDASALATFGGLFQLAHFDTAQVDPNMLRISLVWKPTQQPPTDYSVSVFLLDSEGRSVANHDSSPLNGASPTSAWQPGTVKFDSHTLNLTAALPAGTYQIGLKIYWYGDKKPLPVQATDSTVKASEQADYLLLKQIELGR
jgi:4-amino-4-deoxy-L-arabinose transferase-like glycosyltransferase